MVSEEQRKEEIQKALWYVVYTISGGEEKASIILKNRIQQLNASDVVQEVLVPKIHQKEIRNSELVEVQKLLYRGYIFVKMMMNDEAVQLVRNSPGIIGFITGGVKDEQHTLPVPLTNDEIEEVLRLTSKTQSTYEMAFKTGDSVTIKHGIFADFVGVVKEVDDAKGKLLVLISMFGRETPVEVNYEEVEKGY